MLHSASIKSTVSFADQFKYILINTSHFADKTDNLKMKIREDNKKYEERNYFFHK